MFQMDNLSQEQPKKETRKLLSSKTITITLIQEITKLTLCWLLYTLRGRSRMRRARGQARAKVVTEVVLSTSIIRRWREPKVTEIRPMRQAWTALALLTRPPRTPTAQDKGLAQSIPIQAAKHLGAPSTTSTSKTPCKTSKTHNHPLVSVTKSKCTK